MKCIKCKHCGEALGYVNGQVEQLKCGKCGRRRKLHYRHKNPAIKLAMPAKNNQVA